ncbi:thioredoxin-like protein [Kockiozyma suomiensis]|uniref:thioredoxin-like protein n=1 Tax=Kockiozyma suomiensis TaxID=1337062 RepID=UPI00334324C7
MSIQPRFLAHKLTSPSKLAAAASTTPHTIELYLDYVCPFSLKLFNQVYHNLLPAIAEKFPSGSFTFVFRQQIQPWHPSSTLVHEAALAVERLDASKFWQFSDALFAVSAEYYDTAVADETRVQTYERLAELASKSVGVDKKAFLELLTIKPSEDGKPHNSGNQITNDLKLFIRQARQTSIHVSPTVLVDGIVDNNISSGWTVDQWIAKLEEVYAAN